MKVAIVHDWLYGGGAEKVVEALHEVYPDAPIYTSFATDEWRTKLDGKVVTGVLGKWPLKKMYKYLPLFQQWWFASLDLSDYDVVISSCGNGAARFALSKRKGRKEKVVSGEESRKNLTTQNIPLHISYTHTPTHYYWRKYDEYVKNPSFKPKWLARAGLKIMAGHLRKQDYRAAQKVDYFIANSQHIANDIKTFYGRESTVIHPPVDVARFAKIQENKKWKIKNKETPELYGDELTTNVSSLESRYVMWGRLVPYKRFDIAVAACNQLGAELDVIGDGPELESLKQLAGPTVHLHGRLDKSSDLVAYAAGATGYLFPGEEDFGIAPVEAIAAGVPVIAYKSGGALDYVVEGKTGVLFEDQSVDGLLSAVAKLNKFSFDKEYMADFAAKNFDKQVFKKKIEDFVSSKLH